MARREESRDIDGTRFRVKQLGFAKSRALLVLLAKKIGPAMALLAESDRKRVHLAPAITDAVTNLDDADLEHITEVLCTDAQYSIDGGSKWPYLVKDAREDVFAGRMATYFKFLAFALEVNYSDFLGVLKALPGASDPAEKTPNE